MKKLILLTLGIGFFSVSCVSKKGQISSSNKDSAAVVAPIVKDTMSTVPIEKTMPAETVKVDTVTAPATR